MSSTAKVVVPGTGDTGKTISYNFGTDQWDLVEFTTKAVHDAHVAAGDPHPGYLTPAEGNAAYWQLSTDLATQAEFDAHLNDTVDAHDASAISFVAGGSIMATDVQAAIAEVATDYIAADSAHAGDVNPHPIYLTQTEGDGLYWPLATDLATQAELNAHDTDTTAVHGVANMALLITKIVTDAIALGSAVEIGNGTQALQIWATSGGPVIESKDNQKITIGDGTSAVYVDVTNGRVGIGPSADVAAPAALLHVSRPTSGQSTLFRNTDAAGTTGPILKTEAKTAGSRGYQSGLDTDTVARFSSDIDGTLAWGPGGATSRDTNLYRSAADTLKTDDSLIVGTNLTVSGTVTVGADPLAEVIRDTMGTALVAGTNVTITPNDGADTITIASTGGGGGSVATDTIWDAKGDLAAGTGADTAIRVAVGANDTYLVADSTTASGLKWQALDAELLAIAGLTSAADKLPYFTGSGTAALADFTAAGRALVDDADATAQRATLGLVIGTNVQAFDAELAALAGLTSAADALPYFTGAGTAATTTLTAAGRSLIDDASTTDMRSTLGLVIGTNVQAQDAELQAIAGLTSAADRLPYFTGAGTAALATFTGAGRALVDDADAAAQRTTLGLVIGTDVQAQDAELTAIAGLTSAADRLPYFTGSGTAALATFTAAGRSLVDDASVAAMRVTLELDKRTTFSNADYTAVATDKFVAQVGALSAPRTVTLPAANAVNAGEEIIITDESGSVTGTNTIIISRAGTDTINGGTTVSIPTAYGSYQLVSNGSNAWTAVTKGTRLFYGTTAPSNPSIGDMWLDTTV